MLQHRDRAGAGWTHPQCAPEVQPRAVPFGVRWRLVVGESLRQRRYSDERFRGAFAGQRCGVDEPRAGVCRSVQWSR